jgi:hypothetical protein
MRLNPHALDFVEGDFVLVPAVAVRGPGAFVMAICSGISKLPPLFKQEQCGWRGMARNSSFPGPDVHGLAQFADVPWSGTKRKSSSPH